MLVINTTGFFPLLHDACKAIFICFLSIKVEVAYSANNFYYLYIRFIYFFPNKYFFEHPLKMQATMRGSQKNWNKY